MRQLLLLILTLFSALLVSMPAAAAPPAPQVSATSAGIAIQGYDPVAYFTDGKPLAGTAAHQLQWNGATWYFASEESRAAFEASPDRYAPRFGGYCAWAVSQGYLAPGDPKQWKIVEGKLYLNFNARAKMLWEADLPDAIARGEANWPGVLTSDQDH